MYLCGIHLSARHGARPPAQVLQDNELLLLVAEHRVQPEVAADFCAAAHPKWAERAADAPEDEVHHVTMMQIYSCTNFMKLFFASFVCVYSLR